MVTQRVVFLVSCAAILSACDRAPTGSLLAVDPLLSAAGAPRFTEASGTGPGATGDLAIAFKMNGVGSKAANAVTATATGNAVWACRTGAGEFDGFPAPQVSSATVSASSTLAAKSGQISGTVLLGPPANALVCSAGAHRPALVSAGFAGVQLGHADAGSVPIPGTFDRTFFTLPTETFPVFTDVQLASSTLTIGGGLVDVTATFNNPGATLSPVIMQMWITQGTTFKAANGGSVNCGGALGDLPTGGCTFGASAAAANGAAGSGTLVPGPAVLEVTLRGSPSIRVLAGWRANITLQ